MDLWLNSNLAANVLSKLHLWIRILLSVLWSCLMHSGTSQGYQLEYPLYPSKGYFCRLVGILILEIKNENLVSHTDICISMIYELFLWYYIKQLTTTLFMTIVFNWDSRSVIWKTVRWKILITKVITGPLVTVPVTPIITLWKFAYPICI